MTDSSGESVSKASRIPRHLVFTFFFVVILVTLFEVLRVGMILRNLTSAQGATFGQLLSSFIYGARFDLSMACYIALPVLILGAIPVIGLRDSRRARRIVFVALVALFAVLTFLMLAEYEFFREFQTRYNQLAFQYLDQPKIVVGMVWYNYPVIRYILVCALLAAACGFGLRWIMRRSFEVKTPPQRGLQPILADIGLTVAMAALLVIGMRGGVQAEPLRWGNAYHSSNEFVNQMSLNGLFALTQSGIDRIRHSKTSGWMRRMPADRAQAIARAMIVAPSDKLLDPAGSTVLRESDHDANARVSLAKTDRPPNVVLVLMESFSARFVGACGSKPDYTPAFDKLACEGILFDHAFSGGTHTHQGVFCSMLGFPNLPGFEYLMENIVSNQPFLTLPTLMKQRGYQTMFLYNGNMAWDNMEGFFRKQGIDTFVGSPDYVNPIHRDRVWGVTDQDVFDRANQEFEQADKKGPFFSLVLTLSNHVPFDLPTLPFPATTDQGEMNKRIDGVRYADWAVGHFIDEAKKLKYFQNTLFVFVGDHGFHVDPKLTEAHILFHHVPLLFYSPLLNQKGVMISTAAAQMNILPTIMGLLGGKQAQSSWGRDLFSKEFPDENFVIFKGSGGSGSDQAQVLIRGDKLLIVGSEGSTKLWQYALNPVPSVTPLDDPASTVLRDKMRFELDAYVQTAMTDLTTQHGGAVATSQSPRLSRGSADTTTPNANTELLHSSNGPENSPPVVRPGS